MKDGLREIVGKTIRSVVVGSSDREPSIQVFLVFEDGTYFEFWGSSFNCASAVDPGGVAEASAYVTKIGGEVTRVYPGVEVP